MKPFGNFVLSVSNLSQEQLKDDSLIQEIMIKSNIPVKQFKDCLLHVNNLKTETDKQEERVRIETPEAQSQQSYTPFTSSEDMWGMLVKHGFDKPEKLVKDTFLYKGVKTTSVINVKPLGYIDSFTLVVQDAEGVGDLISIHPAYLKAMQEKSFSR